MNHCKKIKLPRRSLTLAYRVSDISAMKLVINFEVIPAAQNNCLYAS